MNEFSIDCHLSDFHYFSLTLCLDNYVFPFKYISTINKYITTKKRDYYIVAIFKVVVFFYYYYYLF